jgi:hypothetical protein
MVAASTDSTSMDSKTRIKATPQSFVHPFDREQLPLSPFMVGSFSNSP